MIDLIMKEDWYKTAKPEEMRVALMHVEQSAIDRLFAELSEKKREIRDDVLNECSRECGWE